MDCKLKVGKRTCVGGMKDVIFVKDRRTVKGLRQASTVHIVWVVSCEILHVCSVHRQVS